ncbi:MAG: hypothetical protein FRX48_09634 [Lasallia pustulata]|uniref:Uncharacterized protein n=1 Tax=Lasallia pustulata TaxID=136370 RepID=A0A5M8PBA2_9LECA|nr:MAG: hypothetical protein FRX48_09634 [Lasallia pustulata]
MYSTDVLKKTAAKIPAKAGGFLKRTLKGSEGKTGPNIIDEYIADAGNAKKRKRHTIKERKVKMPDQPRSVSKEDRLPDSELVEIAKSQKGTGRYISASYCFN